MNKSEITALAQKAKVGEDAVVWLDAQLGIGGQTAAATVVNPSPTVVQAKDGLKGMTVTHKFFVYADASARSVEYWPVEGSRMKFTSGKDEDSLEIRHGQDVISVVSGREPAHGASVARLHEYVRNRIINQRRN